MRIVVVADVHSNLEAFEAVLTHAHENGGFDAIWSLGDLVGYGPDPMACIELLQSFEHEAIVGNHDYAAIGTIGVDDFNPQAAAVALWTGQQLSLEARVWIGGLDPELVLEPEFTLVHGSLIDPIWNYLVSSNDAAEHLERQSTPYGFAGHTHLPQLFVATSSGAQGSRIEDGYTMRLDDTRFVANPGSTGQPRDGDPRAGYAVVDTGTDRIDFHRVPYDIAMTQSKMRAARLPDVLWQRLAAGR
ncbi:MAG TPA: metallophosphoesterase family protein [Dehalococcoidia bacterium]|nr:metallophosphoesterase family protein [Dehalococcoidia bacterium]